MTHDNETHSHFAGNGELPELNLPLEYDVSFDWGKLLVTEKAHETYNLVPLTPNAVFKKARQRKGSLPGDTKKLKSNLDITLLTPEEVQHTEEGALALTQLHKNGVKIGLSLPGDDESLRGLLDQQVADSIGMLTGRYPEELHDLSDLNRSEIESQDKPQIIAHLLSGVAAAVTSEALSTWLASELDRKTFRRMKAMGAAAIAGSGAMLYTETMTGLPLRTIDLIGPGVFASVCMFNLLSQMKDYMGSNEVRTRTYQALAMSCAAQVAKDIHSIYCRRHFDSEASALFTNETGPGEDA